MTLDSNAVDEVITKLIRTRTPISEIKSRLRALFPDPHITISIIEKILNGQDITGISIAIYDRCSVIHRELSCSSDGTWTNTNVRRGVTFHVG